jgi:hypothetical protein
MRHMARLGETEGIFVHVLVGKPEGERPLGRSRRAWDYNVKMAVKKQDGTESLTVIRFRVGTSGGLL